MTLTRSAAEIAGFFGLQAALPDRDPGGRPLGPRFNIAPSQWIVTIDGADGAPRAGFRRWGLVPSWAKGPEIGQRLFNARSETADQKPSFRSAFKRRRCLVAADGFYEWTPRNRDHQPWHFRPAEGPLLALAGLFEQWVDEATGDVLDTCTVLTTDANDDVAPVHHRMPVLIGSADQSLWLDPRTEPEALGALLVPAAPGTLARMRVGRFVNDPRREGPECLESPGDEEAGPLFGGDASQ